MNILSSWRPQEAIRGKPTKTNAGSTAQAQPLPAPVKFQAASHSLAVSPPLPPAISQSSSLLVDDILQLPTIAPSAVVELLRNRFGRNELYTHLGRLVLAINPYKRVESLYSETTITEYSKKASPGGKYLPPHLFTIGNDAFDNVRRNGADQIISISGESGSGKTESARLLISYIVNRNNIADGKLRRICQMIMDGLGLMESFGNASTSLNFNSSRHGRLIDLAFNQAQGNLVAVQVSDYLLERSRVVCHSKSEKNYHIFYEFIGGLSDDQRRSYMLDTLVSCDYFTTGIPKPNNEMKERFTNINARLVQLGFNVEELKALWSMLASVCHLGTIKFERLVNENGVVGELHLASLKPLQTVASLMKLSEGTLATLLTIKTTDAGGERLTIPLSPDQAFVVRDAIAKFIYVKLFSWLSSKVNASLSAALANPNAQPDDTANICHIGILDIFGFEDFTNKNSLEQLCINFASESLHAYFLKEVIKMEQESYIRDGLKWTKIEMNDNANCIDLLVNKKFGIMTILDDHCFIPNASDASFLNKCNELNRSNPAFDRAKSSMEFGIAHYAGKVWYQTKAFLEKNRDANRPDIVDLLVKSQNPIIASVFASANKPIGPIDPSSPTPATPPRRGRIFSTISSMYQESLSQLIAIVNRCQPHFVRCIRPNRNKTPEVFDPECVLEQLRCGGIIDAARVRKAGYPARVRHAEFVSTYAPLLVSSEAVETLDPPEACRVVLTKIGATEVRDYQVGRTTVFLTDAMFRRVEAEVQAKRWAAISKWQRAAFRYIDEQREIRRVELRKQQSQQKTQEKTNSLQQAKTDTFSPKPEKLEDSAIAVQSPPLVQPVTPTRDFLQEVISYLQNWQLVDDDRHVITPPSTQEVSSAIVPTDPNVLKAVIGSFMQTSFPNQRKTQAGNPSQQDANYISRIVSMFVGEKSMTGLQQFILATLVVVSCQTDGVEALLNSFHNSVFSSSSSMSSSSALSPEGSFKFTNDFVIGEILRSLTTTVHTNESKHLLWIMLMHVVSSYDVSAAQAKAILTTIAADQQQSPSLTLPHLVIFVYQKMFPAVRQLVRFSWTSNRILAPTMLEWISNIRLCRMALSVSFVDLSNALVEVTSHTSVEEFTSLCIRTKYQVSTDIPPQLIYNGWSTALVFAGAERVELWPEAKVLDLISHIEIPQELQPRGRFPGLGLIRSPPAVIGSNASPSQSQSPPNGGSFLSGFFVQAPNSNAQSKSNVQMNNADGSSMISGAGPRQTSTPKTLNMFRVGKHVSFDDDHPLDRIEEAPRENAIQPEAKPTAETLLRQPSITSTNSNLAKIDDYINQLFDFGTGMTTTLQTSTTTVGSAATAGLAPPAPTGATAAPPPASAGGRSSQLSGSGVSTSRTSAIVDTRSLYAHMNNSAVVVGGADNSMNNMQTSGTASTNVKQAARVLDRFLKPDMINVQQLSSQNAVASMTRNNFKTAFVNEGNSLFKLVTMLDDQLAGLAGAAADVVPFITYSNPQWQLIAYKSFLTPSESKLLLDADRRFLRLILAQIVGDVHSTRPGMFSRLSAAEHTSLLNMIYTRRLTKATVLATDNFSSSSNNESNLDIDFMKLVVKMAVDMRLYFAAIYPVSGVVDESGVSTIVTDVALSPRYLSMISRRIDPTTSTRILDTIKSFMWADIEDIVIASESSVKITVSHIGDFTFNADSVDMLADRLSAFTIEAQATVQFLVSRDSVPAEPGDRQLVLRKGDIIYVLDAQPQDGLLYGTCRGRCGFFPIAAVTPLDLSMLPLELRRHFADQRIQDCDLIVDAGTLTSEHLVAIEGWLLRGDEGDRPADKGDTIISLVNRLALRRQREMIEQQALGGNAASAVDSAFPNEIVLLNVTDELRPMCARCAQFIGRFIRTSELDNSHVRELLSGILTSGVQYPPITDEIFLQTVKLIVMEKSPSTLITFRTLCLLSIVARFFRCSDSLRPYIYLLLAEQLASGKNRELILECAGSMTKLGLMGSRRSLPSSEEIDYCCSLVEGRRNPNSSVFVRIFLPGQRRVAVYVDSSSLVREVVDSVMGAIGIETPAGRVGVGSSSMRLSLTESYEYRLYYRMSSREPFTLVTGASFILDLYRNSTSSDPAPQHLDLVIRRLSWLFPSRHLLSSSATDKSKPPHPFLIDMLSFQMMRSWLESYWSPIHAESQDDMGKFVATTAALHHRASINATDDRPPSATELSGLMPRWAYQLRPDWLRSIQQTYFDTAAKLSPQAARRQLTSLLIKECPLGAASFFTLLGAFLPTSAIRGAALLGLNAKGIVVLHPESRVPLFFAGYQHVVAITTDSSASGKQQAAAAGPPGSVQITVRMSPLVLLPPESRQSDSASVNAQQAPVIMRLISHPSDCLLNVLQHHVDLFVAVTNDTSNGNRS